MHSDKNIGLASHLTKPISDYLKDAIRRKIFLNTELDRLEKELDLIKMRFQLGASKGATEVLNKDWTRLSRELSYKMREAQEIRTTLKNKGILHE